MFNSYESKPKTVKAVRFTDADKERIFNSMTGNLAPSFEGDSPILKVRTAHGETAIVRLGDWIVEDIEIGTYYPVKDAAFQASYAPAHGVETLAEGCPRASMFNIVGDNLFHERVGNARRHNGFHEESEECGYLKCRKVEHRPALTGQAKNGGE